MYGHVEKPVRILRISSLTDDGRFNFNINSRKDILVTNNSLVSLGELTFSPSMSCSSDCYCGFNTGIPDGQWFTHGMKLPPNLPEIDSYLYQRLRMRWHALTEKKVKTKVLVDTDRFKSLEIEAETELSWPKLFSHPVVHFPLTAVGNFTVRIWFELFLLILDFELDSVKSINRTCDCSTPSISYLSRC